VRRALLYSASGVTLLFALGHSMGTYGPPRGAQVPVVTVMKTVRFDMFGSERTFWDMFHGYGVIIIGVALFMAFLLAYAARLDARAARPLLLALAALQVLFAVVGFRSFFWAPGLLNAVSSACALAAAAIPA
jgi:hypothetical protein